MEPMLRNPLCSIQIRSRRGSSMPEKKKTAAAAPAVEAPVEETAPAVEAPVEETVQPDAPAGEETKE